jgi:hypothetical protein
VKADAIILANGFQVQKPLLTLNLHGEGGISVAEHVSGTFKPKSQHC